MRTRTQSCITVIAAVFLLSACGSEKTSPPAVCTNTGNMELYTALTGSTLMTSITVTAAQNAAVPSVPVFVSYKKPPVDIILSGYPVGGVVLSSVGIDIVQNGPNTDNPLQFDTTFNAVRAKATYHAVLRFVATDLALSGPLDCQDVQVTFTVN